MATPWCRCRFIHRGELALPELVEMGWISQDKLDQHHHPNRQWRRRGVGLLKTGSAYYAPATSAIQMAESYLKRTRSGYCPAPSMSNGAYGVKDLYVGPAGGDQREEGIEQHRRA